MRRIERTTAFLRDFKRERKGQYRRNLDSIVSGVVSLLIADLSLAEKSRDHSLGATGGTIANAISNPICF
jgi:mRNA interferase YafQ